MPYSYKDKLVQNKQPFTMDDWYRLQQPGIRTVADDEVWNGLDVGGVVPIDDPLIGKHRPWSPVCECGTEKVMGVVEPSFHSDYCPIYKTFNHGGSDAL
jgi:hypothetical protein